jgi:hypothetical protein
MIERIDWFLARTRFLQNSMRIHVGKTLQNSIPGIFVHAMFLELEVQSFSSYCSYQANRLTDAASTKLIKVIARNLNIFDYHKISISAAMHDQH